MLIMQQFQRQQQQVASLQQAAGEQQQQTIQTGVSTDTAHMLRQFAANVQGIGISIPFTSPGGGMLTPLSNAAGAMLETLPPAFAG